MHLFIIYLCCLYWFREINSKELEVLILHNNDIHGRFDEVYLSGRRCKNSSKCYGGFPRMATIVKEARKKAANGSGPPVLFLNAGDTFTGTALFTVYKENISNTFMNLLKPDAASLGNHEFDLGIDVLANTVKTATYPLLAANIYHKDLAINRYTVVKVNDYKIGIVGYITPATKFISHVHTGVFEDEIKAINRVSKSLKQKGVKTIIALGHSGLKMDIKIAELCPLVDVVIGGHTKSLLWNGASPDTYQRTRGICLNVVERDGFQIPVVQTSGLSRYMGKLHIRIDKNTGKVISFKANSIPLNSKVAKDKDFQELLDKYKGNLFKLDNTVVGASKVYLDSRCRSKECNAGNMITDALIHYRAKHSYVSKWTDAAIAIINSGCIRSNIDGYMQNNLTYSDISSMLPFSDKIYVTALKGKHLLLIIKHSLQQHGEGGFLQYSGLKVKYNTCSSLRKRVELVYVRCAICEIPRFDPLILDKTYKILVSAYIFEGGDGYTFFSDYGLKYTALNQSMIDIVLEYLKDKKYVYPGVEGRILFVPGVLQRMQSSTSTLEFTMYLPLLYVSVVLYSQN